MRVWLAVLILAGAWATTAQAVQQIGNIAPPVAVGNGTCPAGYVLDRALNACMAVAPNGCCAPDPHRAMCATAGMAGRWTGRPEDVRSGAVVCPH